MRATGETEVERSRGSALGVERTQPVRMRLCSSVCSFVKSADGDSSDEDTKSEKAPIAHCSAIVARHARAATSHLTGSPAVDLF